MRSSVAIHNLDKLNAVFGGMPDFLDSELVAFSMLGSESRDPLAPSVTITIHLIATSQSDRKLSGQEPRMTYAVTLRFSYPSKIELDKFEPFNTLEALQINDITDRQLEAFSFHVRIIPYSGLKAQFMCRDVYVIHVEPLLKDNEKEDAQVQ